MLVRAAVGHRDAGEQQVGEDVGSDLVEGASIPRSGLGRAAGPGLRRRLGVIELLQQTGLLGEAIVDAVGVCGRQVGGQSGESGLDVEHTHAAAGAGIRHGLLHRRRIELGHQPGQYAAQPRWRLVLRRRDGGCGVVGAHGILHAGTVEDRAHLADHIRVRRIDPAGRQGGVHEREHDGQFASTRDPRVHSPFTDPQGGCDVGDHLSIRQRDLLMSRVRVRRDPLLAPGLHDGDQLGEQHLLLGICPRRPGSTGFQPVDHFAQPRQCRSERNPRCGLIRLRCRHVEPPRNSFPRTQPVCMQPKGTSNPSQLLI